MSFNVRLHSYVFFMLVVFSALALAASEFTGVFSQLFFVLSKDGRVYDLFSVLICLFVLFLLGRVILYTAIGISSRKLCRDSKLVCIILLSISAFVFSVCMFFLFDLLRKIYIREPLDLLFSDNIPVSEFDLYTHSVYTILPISASWMFVLMPLLYRNSKLVLDRASFLGFLLERLEPKTTAIIIFLFAGSMQPYLGFSSNPFVYIDSVLFVSCMVLFLRFAFLRRIKFSFFDCMNVIVMSIGILFCILCSFSLLTADFSNVRFTFYLLGLSCWCGELVSYSKLLDNRVSLLDYME